MRRRRKAPAAVGQSEGPQQPAVAVDDDRRALARGQKIDRPEAGDVARPGDRCGGARDQEHDGGGENDEEAGERYATALPFTGKGAREARPDEARAPHFAVTSSAPNAVRP